MTRFPRLIGRSRRPLTLPAPNGRERCQLSTVGVAGTDTSPPRRHRLDRPHFRWFTDPRWRAVGGPPTIRP